MAASLVLGVLGFIKAFPGSAVVAAPSCEDVPGCVVTVTGEVDSALVIALLLLAAWFAAMAITAVPMALALPGGGGISPPAAETVKDEDVPDSATPLEPSETRQVAGHGDSRDARVRRWLSLPGDVRTEADRLYREWSNDESLAADHLREVRRKAGRGPHPYYLTFELPDGEERTMRVTLSGRNYSGPRASEY